MKLEFRTHAQHLSFEKFRKCNLCSSYRKLFKQIHVQINYIFLIKISKNKQKKVSWNSPNIAEIKQNDFTLNLIPESKLEHSKME